MKVAHVISTIRKDSGGTGAFISALSEYLPNSQDKFALVSSTKQGCEDIMIDQRMLSKLIPRSNRVDFRPVIEELRAGAGYELVHLHGLWEWPVHQVAKWAQGKHLPLILSPHGMLHPWAMSYKKWKKQLAWYAYQQADLRSATAFHATAEQEAECLRSRGLTQPIAVIPNGITVPKVRGREHRPKSNSAFPEQPKTLLFLSRIHPIKGLSNLLRAWAETAPSNWCLKIAGQDEMGYLTTLRKEVSRLKIGASVEFLGPLFGESKHEAFESADAFVLPSHSENFGIVVAEALSYSIPVLTTTGCPWRDLESKRCGWWVTPDVAGLKSGLEAVFSTDRSQLEEMGRRGRQLVEDAYQWESVAARMRAFYGWILGERERPDFVI